jgi:uncharacterized protein (UPF0335 family)
MAEKMLITTERLENALAKLASTDGEVADLHAEVERAEYRAKAVKDAVFLRSEGSVAERTAIAGTHLEYAASMEKYFAALAKHETVKNERSREVLIIDVWRSMSSARTKGLIQ